VDLNVDDSEVSYLMSYSRVRTKPDLSIGSEKHEEAIENRDFGSWQYNVQDCFKGMFQEKIREILRASAPPLAVCFEHWTYDFNLGTGIRNANAFNAKEVFYVGDKRWDKRSAQGVYYYTPVTWLSTIEELKEKKKDYMFVGIDNIPETTYKLTNFPWCRNTMMIFGEESTGLTPEMIELCDHVVSIPMCGSVRSLNCGTASGIALYEYRKYFDII